MDAESRTQRRQELLHTTSLGTLISLYRHAHGLNELDALPNSLTYETLVEAILDCEGITGLSGTDGVDN